jgi:hypothetical protein
VKDWIQGVVARFIEQIAGFNPASFAVPSQEQDSS